MMIKKNRIYHILKKALSSDDMKYITFFSNFGKIPIDNLEDSNDLAASFKKKQSERFAEFINKLYENKIVLFNKNNNDINALIFNAFFSYIENKNNNLTEKNDIILPLTLIFTNIANTLSDNYNEKIIRNILNKLFKCLIDINILTKRFVLKKETWLIILDKSCLIKILTRATDHIVYNRLYKYIFINKKPQDWFFLDNEGLIIKNTEMNINVPFISVSNNILNQDFKSFINQNYLDKINKIQKIGYTINLDLFIYIFEKCNLADFYTKVKKEITISCDFDYDKYVDEILTEKVKSLKKIEDKEKYINKLKEDLHKMSLDDITDRDNSITLVQLLVLWFIYDYNDEDKIYHLNTIEFRGRVSLAGIINYISDKLFRFLICIEDTNNSISDKNVDVDKYYIYYFANQYWNKEIDSFQTASNKYSEYIKRFNDDKEILNDVLNNNNINITNKMNLIKIIREKGSANISIDATSSLLQIIGVLTKNIKLMTYTNVLVNEKSLDIYTYLIEKITFYLKGVDDNNKNNIFTKNDLYFKEYYINRKIVKYVCMTWLYGSTSKYIAHALKALYKLKNILLLDLTSISNKIIKVFMEFFPVINHVKSLFRYYINLLPPKMDICYNLIDKKLVYNISSTKKIKISSPIDDNSDMKKENKNIINKIKEEIKEIENKLSSILTLKNKSSKIWTSDNFNSLNKLLAKKKKRILILEKKKTITVNVNITDFNNKDQKKKRRSFFVNAIHSLDSQICINLREKLLSQKGIESLSVHDCFLVNLKNYEQCLRHYNHELGWLLNTNFIDIISDLKNLSFFPKKVMKFYFDTNDISKAVYHLYQFIRNFKTKVKINLNKNMFDIKNNDFIIIQKEIDEFIKNYNENKTFIPVRNFELLLQAINFYSPFKEHVNKNRALALQWKYISRLNNNFLNRVNSVFHTHFKYKYFKSERLFLLNYKLVEKKLNFSLDDQFKLIFTELFQIWDNDNIYKDDIGEISYNLFSQWFTQKMNYHISELNKYADFDIEKIDEIWKSEYSLKPE